MPQEFLGYESQSEGVDFAGEARKLAEQIQGIDQRRQLEKEELDAMNTLDMKAYQYGNNQTTDTFVHNGADIIRGKMFDWNKQLKGGLITPREYKARMNNVKSYWGSLAETAQSYGDRLMQHIEREQAGESSIHENFSSRVFADLQNLEQKSVYIDEQTGAILLYNTDEEGRSIGEPIDIHHLNNPNNVIEAKVNVPETVSEAVSNWAAFEEFKDLGGGATSTKTDTRLNDMFDQSVAELQYTMIHNTPNAVVSIIGDNGVAGVYESYGREHNIYVSEFLVGPNGDMSGKEIEKQEQLETLKKKLKLSNQKPLTPEEEQGFLNEVDKYMMAVTRDANGTLVTHPTEFHEEIAAERIRHEIEINLGHKESGTKAYKKSTGGSGGSGDGKKYINGYTATVNAMGGDFSGLSNNYIYKKTADGVAVYKRYNKEGFDLTDEILKNTSDYKPVVVANNSKQLSVYAFGGSQDAAMNKWDKANKVYGGESDRDNDGGETNKENLRDKYNY